MDGRRSIRCIFPPKAKRVIWLCMAGGPSHLETFDPKPKLRECTASRCRSAHQGTADRAAPGAGAEVLRAAVRVSRSLGRCGAEICELFPQIGSVADDICIIRSMTTEAINHDPAHMFMNTGTHDRRPASMGSWVTYGLGSEAENLPGFVVLTSHRQRRAESADRRAPVVGGLSAEPLPRRAAARQGRPGSVSHESRRASRATQQRDVVEAVNAINARHERRSSTIRKSPRASRSTRWRFRCRRACRS